MSAAQKLIACSFTHEELAELSLIPEFILFLAIIETTTEAEALIRTGHRFLLEAKGIKRPDAVTNPSA